MDQDEFIITVYCLPVITTKPFNSVIVRSAHCVAAALSRL